VLAWLLSFLSGPLLNSVVAAYKTKLEAAGKQDVLATNLAVEEIKADIAARAEASKIVIAEQGRWYTAMIRPLMAAPFVLFTWKVIVYDKLLGWGATDALDPKMWGVFMIVVGAYFGGRSLEKVAQVFANRPQKDNTK
jgi:hypothetical protein